MNVQELRKQFESDMEEYGAVNPDTMRETLDRLEASEKVCESAQALSRLYDGDLDTNKPLLYETWAAVDNALIAWQGIR